MSLTANTENVGSVKSITNNGGIFCDEIIDSDGLPLKRFWFDSDVLNEVGSKVILRDLTNEDIADRINWLTNFIEWQRDWDGPWEYKERNLDEMNQYIKEMQGFLNNKAMYNANINDEELRTSFEIETKDGEHIGWVNSYKINDDLLIDEHGDKLAIGIDIPDPKFWEKGYGTDALKIYIRYLNNKGIQNIYLQTWSGNERMIHVAEKVGFELFKRKVNFREVHNKIFDGLTFKLK